MAGPYRPKPTYKPGGRRPDPRQQKKDEDGLNINGQITAPQVRLVGDNIPEPGIWPLAKALQLADQLELDLVEISAKADPPVCKILDYQKYLYQQRKKAKEMKSNAAKVVIKEIRFGPTPTSTTFSSSSSTRPNSSRRAPRSRLPFSSAGVPSCSPSRERSSSSVLR